MSQVVSADARQDDVPLPGPPGDLDQAPVLQCLAAGLVGAELPYARRAPRPHPLQYRKLTFIDLPLQWPAFDSRLTFGGRMFSALAVNDGGFTTDSLEGAFDVGSLSGSGLTPEGGAELEAARATNWELTRSLNQRVRPVRWAGP